MTDIVVLLRKYQPYNTLHGQAADEIERLRSERHEWFAVARQLRDALHVVSDIEEAVNEYLRVRGRLEDPRDCIPEATNG